MDANRLNIFNLEDQLNTTFLLQIVEPSPHPRLSLTSSRLSEAQTVRMARGAGILRPQWM